MASSQPTPTKPQEFLSALGVSAATGQPLAPPTDATIAEFLKGNPEKELLALRGRASPAEASFGVIGEIDANDLSQAGWGVLFAPGVSQAIKDALQPLLDHRRAIASPFKIYDGPETAQPGESATQWLNRQGVSLNVVDPTLGVPFYLLIVGPPDTISFEFQYTLDIHWGVGRIWFESPDEFRQYAESVVGYETAATVPTTREAALFCTEHEFDTATRMFTEYVAKPLLRGVGATPMPLGKRQKFDLNPLLGDQATKDNLANLCRGKLGRGTPSLLFSGSHGMEFPNGDPSQLARQGALVCQDWDGYGGVDEKDWFAAEDIPDDARLHGLVHFLFACHGGGCAEFDNFDRLGTSPRRIAPQPFVSRLPQRMLSHPQGGALAVLAHVERAWAFSFVNDRAGPQTQGFRDVLGRIMRGERLGQATDAFNVRWAALSTQLADTQNEMRMGLDVPLATLGQMWVARDDARNYVILGDPAVRLRVEDIIPPTP